VRTLYTLVMYLMTPVILFRLAWRGLRYREYFSRWRERFGYFVSPELDRPILVHAVSVGEFNAAVPLIEALMQRYAERRFVITTITPTGSERVRAQFGDRVFHVYLPYDLPTAVRRFLDRIRPSFAVVMETEIWPNLFIACRERGVPIVLANARLSQRSLLRYRPVASLARRALRCCAFVAAQSQTDARRLLRLGADPQRLSVAGNLKFELAVPESLASERDALRALWGAARPVWIAASTHDGEDELVLRAHIRLLRMHPDALLLIAPRHPERFRSVLALSQQLGLACRVRTQHGQPQADTQCFVIDTMGELLGYFGASDVAFVAGSFAPIGGHNVLEPAVVGRPVIVGPHTFNFSEVTEALIEAGAAVRVEDSAELAATLERLMGDPDTRTAMGRAALALVGRERGAVDRTMAIVADAMHPKSAPFS